MDFSGRITHIGAVESFTNKDGKILLSREVVLTTDEQYPRSACFTLRNEMAQNFAYHIGDSLSVRFDLYARANKEGSRYFNHLTIWRIDKLF
jgi:hypothetical protein